MVLVNPLKTVLLSELGEEKGFIGLGGRRMTKCEIRYNVRPSEILDKSSAWKRKDKRKTAPVGEYEALFPELRKGSVSRPHA